MQTQGTWRWESWAPRREKTTECQSNIYLWMTDRQKEQSLCPSATLSSLLNVSAFLSRVQPFRKKIWKSTDLIYSLSFPRQYPELIFLHRTTAQRHNVCLSPTGQSAVLTWILFGLPLLRLAVAIVSLWWFISSGFICGSRGSFHTLWTLYSGSYSRCHHMWAIVRAFLSGSVCPERMETQDLLEIFLKTETVVHTAFFFLKKKTTKNI